MADNTSDFNIRVKVDPSDATAGLEQVHGGLEGIEGLLAKIGLSVGLAELGKQAFELSEAYENVQNRLRNITSGEKELADTTHQLFQVSEETRSSFAGTAEVYAKLARASQGLGIPQSDLLQVTKELNEVAIVSGKSTESLTGVVGQLAIGLQTGTLNGRALRLILRDYPDLGAAIEKQLGVTSQEFKKLGQEGKLSAEDLLHALVASREELEEKFGKVVPTASQQMDVFKTKLTEFVGEANESTHATQLLGKGIEFLGDHVPVLVGVVGTLSIALGVQLAATALPAAVGALGTFDVALIATVGPIAALAGAIGAVGLKVIDLANDIKQAQEDAAGVTQLTDFGQQGANIELLKKKIKDLQETIAKNPDNEIAKRNLEGYREDLEKLTDEHKKVAEAAKGAAREQVDASKSVIEDLDRELKLLEKTTAEREIATKEYALEKAAQAATGTVFTDAQRDEVTARLEKIKTLTDEEKLLDEIHGPQEKYEERVRNATDLLNKQKITQQEFNDLFKDRQVLYEADTPQPTQGPDVTVERSKNLDQYLNKLQHEHDLIGLTNEQRELSVALDHAQLEAGRQLTDTEINQVTTLIKATKLREDAAKEAAAAEKESAKLREEVLNELRGPEEKIVGLQTQLNILYHDGTISVQEYNRALEKLNITAHQTDVTFSGGLSSGLSKIQLQLDDFATLGEKTVTDAFNGMTDSLVGFVKTGKLNVTSLVDSIQEDLARLLVQQGEKALFGNLFGNASGSGSTGDNGILGSLGSSLGSFFGGLFAEGGDAPADKPIIVGERGPELVKLKHPGTVIPAGQTKDILQGGGGGKAPNVNVAPPKVDVHVTNQIDSTAVVQNGLRTREGEAEVLNIIARNRQAVRSNLT